MKSLILANEAAVAEIRDCNWNWREIILSPTMEVPRASTPGGLASPPRASTIVILSLEDLAWQVLASAAAPSLGWTERRQKRKRESMVK